MIPEYLQLQAQMRARAGRIITELAQNNFFAVIEPEIVRLAAPAVADIDLSGNGGVIIFFGKSVHNGQFKSRYLNVPLGLFEDGSPAAIADWSYSQNEAEKERIKQLTMTEIEKKLDEEYSIFFEIAAKYPELADKLMESRHLPVGTPHA